MNVKQIMRLAPVIPVLSIDNDADAVPLARALLDGGLPVIEVTLRTPAALAAVEAIAKHFPDLMVGVGTVIRPDDLRLARDAGARFAISPGATSALLASAQSGPLPFMPGVMTPSDLMVARTAGFTEMKLFPAKQAGGVGMLKALAGPFPDVSFCPTGGITLETAPDYLALNNVICVGGSWMVPRASLRKQDWSAITELARQASSL